MNPELKPPSLPQLAWVLVVVLALAGLMFHLDWSAGDHVSAIPARDLVGTWVVDFGGRGMCREIHPDGTFTEVNFGNGVDGRPYRGRWSVRDEVITWDARATPHAEFDASVVTFNVSTGRFMTRTSATEMDGMRYEWLVYKRLPGLGARCTPAAIAEIRS